MIVNSSGMGGFFSAPLVVGTKPAPAVSGGAALAISQQAPVVPLPPAAPKVNPFIAAVKKAGKAVSAAIPVAQATAARNAAALTSLPDTGPFAALGAMSTTKKLLIALAVVAPLGYLAYRSFKKPTAGSVSP